MTHLVIDPVTRTEGHLRIEVDLDGDVVRRAWVVGTMFRGIEAVIAGRDPRDAWIFAQRICNVCTSTHAIASLRAVEDALGLEPPPLAVVQRSLITVFQYVSDHAVTVPWRGLPDWVDPSAVERADPGAAARLAASVGARDRRGELAEVLDLLRDRPGGGAHLLDEDLRGHPGLALGAEAGLVLVAHAIGARERQRRILEAHAILGGRNPAPEALLVGGTARPCGAGSVDGIDAAAVDRLRGLAREARVLVRELLLPDLRLLVDAYPEWSRPSERRPSLLSFGDLALDPFADRSGLVFPGGVVWAGRLGSIARARHEDVTESVVNSWYERREPSHPWDEGVTPPRYTGPAPPYEQLDLGGAYSWVKTPRLRDHPVEVGPLARVVVGWASGDPRIRLVTAEALAELGLPFDALFSVLGRAVARLIECRLLLDVVPTWLDGLEQAVASADPPRTHAGGWLPEEWPDETQGVGLHEAPRGALGHWLRIERGRIASYQCVAPGTWTASPRDASGRPGPLEAALAGTRVADPDRPVELLRTVHAFAPCMTCATH